MRSAKCGAQLLNTENFRQCKNTAIQKNYCFASRHSLLAIRCRFTIRQSLIAIRRHFGSAGASPSHFLPRPPPRVPRPFPFLSPVPCPLPLLISASRTLAQSQVSLWTVPQGNACGVLSALHQVVFAVRQFVWKFERLAHGQRHLLLCPSNYPVAKFPLLSLESLVAVWRP